MRTIALWAWLLALAAAVPLALRLPEVVQGATEIIPGSESDRANRALERAFGTGAPFAAPVVLEGSGDLPAAADTVSAALSGLAEVRAVRPAGNSGGAVLLLVESSAASIGEAEALTPVLRRAIADASLPSQFSASVTGTAATFYDLNHNASDDLKKAELVALPLTALILLAVFRSPLAALLPLALAGAASIVTLAALYLLSPLLPVSVFAQNAVSMIGLGAGVDYALFVLQQFRAALARGAEPAQAALAAVAAVRATLLCSGAVVASGFLALLLVEATFLRSVAVGGLLVIGCVLALSLTALPAALALIGPRINWPRRRQAPRAPRIWGAWAERVMLRPWGHLLAGAALLALLASAAVRAELWNVGASDLPPQLESRRGYDVLARHFGPGWMGPVAIVIEGPGAAQAIPMVSERVAADPRVAAVTLAGATDGTAWLLALPRHAPEAPATMALVEDLRELQWRGVSVHIGGATAAMRDFDAEMLGSLWRVLPAVLALSGLALLACFRSLVVPLKAMAANLAAVLGAYGALVLVFGALNSFIVLMLFTILFGLSMDYEVFLLRAIQEERAGGRDNQAAVAAGLERSAGLITSAAAVMVCVFASFTVTELQATREFGLGLAVAVALDATLIRLVVMPAAMKLLGEANWWFPLGPKEA